MTGFIQAIHIQFGLKNNFNTHNPHNPQNPMVLTYFKLVAILYIVGIP